VIDSLSFPVFLRLLFLSIASEGLYLLLAARSRVPPGASPLAHWYPAVRFEETAVFLGLWAALFVVYALAVRATRDRSGRALFLFIFVTSSLFRLSLLLEKGGFATGAAEGFFHAASPIRAAMEFRPGFEAIAAVLFDLGSLALLPSLLRALTLPAGLALVYGWNPLLIKEGAASGRLETIPLFFLLLAFLLLQKKRPAASALLYGASLAGPPFFWATLPLAARALGARLVLSLLVIGLAWAPLAATTPWAELLGWPPSSSLGGSLMPAAATLARLFVTRDPRAALFFCAGAWLLLALARTTKLGPGGDGFPREALGVLGGFLFLSPEVLPWAFVPIAGLAAFSANPGWIVATATAPLGYLALGGGRWSFWLAFAQYFPVYASLVFVALGTKRGRKRGPGKAK
jgi:hypothetical protein